MSHQSDPWKRCFRHSSHQFREKPDIPTVSSCRECSTLNRSWKVGVHNRVFSFSFRDERPSSRTEKIWSIGIGEECEEDEEKVRNGESEIVFGSPESWLSKAWMKELKEGKLGRQTAAIAIDEVQSVTEWYVSLFA